jgi:hypothetical protein
MFGRDTTSLTAALAYAKQHGGGTVAASSQSGAAGSLITSGANVAAIGGFSGRESEVSDSWLASAVQDGRIRWALTSSDRGGGMPDGRAGSTTAMAAVATSCKAVSSVDGLYDCSHSTSALRAASLTRPPTPSGRGEGPLLKRRDAGQATRCPRCDENVAEPQSQMP